MGLPDSLLISASLLHSYYSVVCRYLRGIENPLYLYYVAADGEGRVSEVARLGPCVEEPKREASVVRNLFSKRHSSGRHCSGGCR
jgi:hypothetical protein